MAAWIHLIFYSMMTYISGMKPVCMNFETIEIGEIYSCFFCSLTEHRLCTSQLRTPTSLYIDDWIHLIVQSMMTCISEMKPVCLDFEKKRILEAVFSYISTVYRFCISQLRSPRLRDRFVWYFAMMTYIPRSCLCVKFNKIDTSLDIYKSIENGRIQNKNLKTESIQNHEISLQRWIFISRGENL